MFSSTIIALIIVFLIIVAWQSTMRGKERALAYCKTLCKAHQMQLLDETVSLKKVQLRRTESGRLGLLRTYTFEYNLDGNARHTGEVQMLGRECVGQQWFSPVRATAAEPSAPVTGAGAAKPNAPTGKILDFTKLTAHNDDNHS